MHIASNSSSDMEMRSMYSSSPSLLIDGVVGGAPSSSLALRLTSSVVAILEARQLSGQ